MDAIEPVANVGATSGARGREVMLSGSRTGGGVMLAIGMGAG